MNKEKQIKVVLSGSGTLYPIHAGALHFLVENGYEIEAIAGVSGGAIVASAVSSGYTPGPELNELILETMPGPNNLIDVSFCPLWGWGLIKGDKIEKKLRELLRPKFFDLKIPTKIYAVNVDRKGKFPEPTYTIFGTKETPEVNVSEAVRASMSIPGVFQPKEIMGEKFVDGGLVSNFPLNAFGNAENVLGFHLRGIQDFKAPESLASYVSNMAKIMMASINRRHVDETTWKRTILLETEMSSINFRYTKEDAKTMLEFGYNRAKKLITKT